MKTILVLIVSLLYSVFITFNYPFLDIKIYQHKNDTLVNDEYNASDLFLSIKYKYIEGDTMMSNRLMKEQVDFLTKMNLPVSSLDENNRYSAEIDLVNIDENYEQTTEELNGNKYQNLYRQVCSQVIIKKICAKYNSLKDSVYFSKRLEFYLDEMRNSGGINVPLVYAGILKLKRHGNSQDYCSKLNKLVSYTDSLVKNRKNEFVETVNYQQKEKDPISLFVMEDQKERIAIDEIFLSKINRISEKLCAN